MDTLHVAPAASVKKRAVASTRREPLFRAFILGLGTLLLAFFAQRQLYEDQIETAALLFGVALLLFVIPFRRQLRLPLLVAVRIGGKGGWSLLWRVAPALLAIGLSGLALRSFQGAIEQPPLSAWWLHIGSILFILLFALLLDWRAPRQKSAESSDRPETEASTSGAAGSIWWQVAAWLLIGMTAIFFRLWRFDELPFGIWYDEAENGLQALRILNSDNFWPIFVGSIHAPAHYLYLIAFFFQTVDVSVQSIRLVSVVMGLATVAAAFWWGANSLGVLGLAAAFIVAVARWNVNFSRIGMYNASTPLFELLTVGFLLRAVRRGRYFDYALAGLWLGLGLCFMPPFSFLWA
ncbi:MAG: glycosyltransferase family 39 protein [Caldilineaceae bacterium]